MKKKTTKSIIILLFLSLGMVLPFINQNVEAAAYTVTASCSYPNGDYYESGTTSITFHAKITISQGDAPIGTVFTIYNIEWSIEGAVVATSSSFDMTVTGSVTRAYLDKTIDISDYNNPGTTYNWAFSFWWQITGIDVGQDTDSSTYSISEEPDLPTVSITTPDGDTYPYSQSTTTFEVTVENPYDTNFYCKFETDSSYTTQPDSHSKVISYSYTTSNGDYLVDLTIDIDSFETGEHSFYFGVRDSDGFFHSDSTPGVFYRLSEAPPTNSPPSISVTTPDASSAHDVGTGSITTTATIEDPDGSLDSVKVYWDGGLNKSWSYPAEGSFSHSISILDGVTTNGTHTIRWWAEDNDGDTRYKEVNVIVYDSLLLIERLEPERLIQGSNDFDYSFNFTTDSSDLDTARHYIMQDGEYLGINISTLQTNSTNDFEVSASGTTYYLIELNESYKALATDYSISTVEELQNYTIEDSGDYVSSNWYDYEDYQGNTQQIDYAVGHIEGERNEGDGYYTFWDTYNGYIAYEEDQLSNWQEGDTYFEFRVKKTAGLDEFKVAAKIYNEDDYLAMVYDESANEWKIGILDTTYDWSFHTSSIYAHNWANGDWITIRLYFSATNDDARFYINTDGNAIDESSDLVRNHDDDHPYCNGGSYINTFSIVPPNVNDGDPSHISIDYFKTWYDGCGTWTETSEASVGLNYSNNCSSVTAFGDDYAFSFTTAEACRFDIEVNTTLAIQYYEIFDSYSGMTTTQNWTLDSDYSSSLTNGEFTNAIYLELDNSATSWYNFSMDWDNIPPTVTIAGFEDEETYLLGYLPGLQVISNWGLNENDSNAVMIELDYHISTISYKKWVWSDTQDQDTKPDDFPTSGTQFIQTEGNHTLKVTLIDVAGNSNYQAIWFVVEREKEITFALSSSLDGTTIPWGDARDFEIFIEGMPVYDLQARTILDNFELTINDPFGNNLYSSTISYSANIAVSIAVRRVSLRNGIAKPIEATVSANGRSQERAIAGTSSTALYLADGSYTVLADPKNALRSADQKYVATSTTITVSDEATSFRLECDIEFMNPGAGGGSSKIIYYLQNNWVLLLILVFSVLAVIGVFAQILKQASDEKEEETKTKKEPSKARAIKSQGVELGRLDSSFEENYPEESPYRTIKS